MAPTHMPTLTDRARNVLTHLLEEPYGEHTASQVARATGINAVTVGSVFALLEAHGWAERHDGAGLTRPLVLTAAGRDQGAQAVADGPGIPLHVLDDQDPALADRVRAMVGFPLRHTAPPKPRRRKATP